LKLAIRSSQRDCWSVYLEPSVITLSLSLVMFRAYLVKNLALRAAQPALHGCSRGIAVGAADTATPDPYAPNCITDCFVARGFQFKNDVLTDLGALPGVNTSYPFAINEREVIVGISENGSVDPLTGSPETDAVLWKDGEIVNLGTLGGNQGVAFGVNDRSQVVGVASNTIADPFSASIGSGVGLFPGTTQVHPFLWEEGIMQDLGTLGGPDSAASYVNERGQVAGQSFTTSVANKATGIPTQDPFLWFPCDRDHSDNDCNSDPESGIGKNGRMLDLGTLGGTFGLVAGLNNKAQVIGRSNLAGDHTRHPFLWERGHMQDLGTLGGDFGYATWLNDAGEVVGVASLPIPCPGCEQGPQVYHGFFWKQGVMTDLGTLDKCSITFGINSKSQIVGSSGLCGIAKHAFVSEGGGPLIDLNSLVVGGSDLQLLQAIYINDRGEIAGNAVAANGDQHAYMLIPCDGDHPALEGCDYDAVRTATVRPNDDSVTLHLGPPENSPRTGNYKRPSTAVHRP
jgi:probable HAF family extracellular repeat protein